MGQTGTLSILRKSLPYILTLVLQAISLSGQVVPDSLNAQLIHADSLWVRGKAAEAFTTLDKITELPLSPEIAEYKIDAALKTAHFLVEWKKFIPAKKFLDSASTWASAYPSIHILKNVYQANTEYYRSSGNIQSYSEWSSQLQKLQDSVKNIQQLHIQDSLAQRIRELESEQIQNKETVTETEDKAEPSDTYRIPAYIFGITSLLFLAWALSLKSKRKDAVPAHETNRPADSNSTAGNIKKPEVTTSAQGVKPAIEIPSAPLPAPAIARTVRATDPVTSPPPNRELTARLSEVELVLIRPEVLGYYQKGDIRSIRSLLNEYLDELSGVMKVLDDAISKNEGPAILSSLHKLKPFLESFGMQTTIAWIGEIEAEAPTTKVSKLLSRVFQVRNHCRRAADEAKALLEKLD